MRLDRPLSACAALAIGGLVAMAWAMGPDRTAVADIEGMPGQLIPHDNAVAVARRATVYTDHCAGCHGTDLERQVPDFRVPGPDGLLPAPPHDETGHTWHYPDTLLVDIVTRGTEAVVGGGYRSAMIGFSDVLTEDEILASLAYIKSRWLPQIIAAHNEPNARAAVFAD